MELGQWQQREFIRQLLQNPENTVIGLVRNVESSKQSFGTDGANNHFHIVRGDLDDAESLSVGFFSPLKVEAIAKLFTDRCGRNLENQRRETRLPDLQRRHWKRQPAPRH